MGKIKWIFAAIGAFVAAFATQLIAAIIYSIGAFIRMFPDAYRLVSLGLSSEDYDVQIEILLNQFEQQINADAILITGLAALVNVVVFGLWYYLNTRKYPRIVYREAITISNVGSLIVLGIGLQFITSGALNIVLNLPALEEISYEYMELIGSLTEGNVVLSVLLTVLIAPVSEEFVFRGIILRFGRRCMPFFAANILQALFFGIYHMNIVQGVYAFMIGLVLGYMMKKFNTIIMPILLHAAINASSYLIEPINNLFERYLTVDGLEYIILGVGLLIMTIILYYLLKKPDCICQNEVPTQFDNQNNLGSN